MSGSNIYDVKEITHLEETQPPIKSKLAEKKALSNREWSKKFVQEKAYMQNLEAYRERTHFDLIPIVRAMDAI